MSTPEIVIVGTGPGGLASSMLLAASGFKVTVLERAGYAGGRTSTLDLDGYRFDRGPTFFLYPQVLERVFARCGHNLHDEVELIRLDPNYRLMFEDGGELDTSCNVGRLKQQVAKFSEADAQQIDAYFADNRQKFEAFRPVLESPLRGHADLLNMPLTQVAKLARPWSSVGKDLAKFFSDPRVRLAFSFQSKYLGMSPEKCPSLFTILAFIEYEFGIFHPVGGCGAVSRAMHRVAERMGVEFAFNEPVQELVYDGRTVTAVRTPSREYSSDAVVMNADFAAAARQLIPNRLRRRWNDRKLDRAKMSCSTYMLYLGLDRQYESLPHHTIYISKDYEQHLAAIDTTHSLPQNPALYVHNPSVLDPSMAPPGESSLYVLVPMSHEHPNIDWSAERTGYREIVLDQLEHVGLDNIRHHIKREQIFTPSNWATDMNLFRGATFSLSHSLDQLLSLRPRNRFEDLDNVYLTGGGTHPGSGLPVIYQSALNAARLVAEDLGAATEPESIPALSGRWPHLADEGAQA